MIAIGCRNRRSKKKAVEVVVIDRGSSGISKIEDVPLPFNFVGVVKCADSMRFSRKSELNPRQTFLSIKLGIHYCLLSGVSSLSILESAENQCYDHIDYE